MNSTEENAWTMFVAWKALFQASLKKYQLHWNFESILLILVFYYDKFIENVKLIILIVINKKKPTINSYYFIIFIKYFIYKCVVNCNYKLIYRFAYVCIYIILFDLTLRK